MILSPADIAEICTHLAIRLPEEHEPVHPSGDDLYRDWAEADWNAYAWNPIGQFGYDEFDAAASPKPTWQTLTDGYLSWMLAKARRAQYRSLDAEESRRITAAYIGPGMRENEILYRLRAPATELEPKDTERNRLHARAVVLKAWLDDSTRTLAEVLAFDPTLDTHWAASPP